MSDIYPTGAMDPYIRIALDRAAACARSTGAWPTSSTRTTWHPLSVICPTCGKVGTTIVTQWDGERVFYECRPNLVTWARGCGDVGLDLARSAATAKLPWNLEWAAQWSPLRRDDRAVRQGPRRPPAGRATGRDAIAREVFEREPPLNVPYEFLNIGGQKMSTSKGRGRGGPPIVEVVPPEQLRFLFLRPRPQPGHRVRPRGHATRSRACSTSSTGSPRRRPGARSRASCRPATSRCSATRSCDPDADVAAEAAAFRPAFAHLALLVQMPSVDVRSTRRGGEGERR